MALPAPPLWLVAERDRIIANRQWSMIIDEIKDCRVRDCWPHRAVLAFHLRKTTFGGHHASWPEIAACIGFASHSGVLEAARLYESVEKELKDRHERERDWGQAARYARGGERRAR